MKRTYLLLAAFLFSINTFALENSEGVTVTPLTKTTASWDGTPLNYPKGKTELSGFIVELAVGAQTGWHKHPVPSFAYIMEGELDVHLKDGRVKHVKTGESFAEVVNTLHNGVNVGKTPVKIMVFYAGSANKNLTIKEKSEK